MAEPKQLSLELPSYLTRWVPAFQNPGWTDAQRWRNIVHRQPVAGLCQGNLVRDCQGTQFEIRPKNPKEEDSLADDIEHYTEVVNPDMPGALSGFDVWIDVGVKDLLSLPIGFNNEVVRFPDGYGPLSRDHGRGGHVAWIAYMDGATVSVTYDNNYPLMQSLPENITERVYFGRDQIARTVMDARADMRRWGYGMPPPERVYLALEMLVRSDTYYANLLIDTPEAGLLDLGGMDVESAKQWLAGFRELLTGIDPFKIPVLYANPNPAKYIPFNRPPTELMLNEQTIKYAQITAAAYGLALSDIGLGDAGKTLAGSIRDERKSRRSGYGTIKEKIRNLINNEILPDYLEFVWIENDTETKIQNSRAFLLSAQAFEKAKALGAVTAKEAQAQLVAEGYITVEVEEPEEQEPPVMPQLPPGQTPDNARQQLENEVNKVPESQGGRGDVTGQATQKAETKAELGDESITAAPSDAPFDKLASIFARSFDSLSEKATRPRLMRLIKAATRRTMPDVQQAFTELSEAEITHYWLDERLKLWFGEKSEYDDLPEVKKAADEVLEALEDALEGDSWWAISPDIAAIVLILKTAFEQGATIAAEDVQEFLYTEGLVDSPQIVNLNFSLKNPRTLAELESKAAQLVTRVNDGTKFYLKRIITAGVDEGLASPEIARMIREGEGADAVLREAGFTEAVIERARVELGEMSEGRVASIVNTEINRSESMGRLRQWSEMGLERKQWRTFGNACEICKANEAEGLVPMDYVYRDVFDGTLTPPGHPAVCRCSLVFDEQELISRSDELDVWTGD